MRVVRTVRVHGARLTPWRRAERSKPRTWRGFAGFATISASAASATIAALAHPASLSHPHRR
jgi:hypothetical protein